MDNPLTNVVEVVDSKKAVLLPKMIAMTKASRRSQASARKSAKPTVTIVMTPTEVASEEALEEEEAEEASNAETTNFKTFEDLMTQSYVTWAQNSSVKMQNDNLEPYAES